MDTPVIYAIEEVNEMKKRISILTICLVLMGCQTSEKASDETQASMPSSSALKFQNIFDGAGNEHGYYRIDYRNIADDTAFNIYYYDYTSKKEVFLCDKPECKHLDSSCTSYLEHGLIEALFLHENHLYLISNELSASDLDGSMASGPKILQMDLDGKNKKLLCTLPDNYSFAHHAIAMDERYLYLPIDKSSLVEINSGSSMNTITESKLYAIDLTTGVYEEFMDFRDQQIIGTKDRSLVLAKYTYSEDPDKLLKEKDFVRYDEVMLNAICVYMTYDIDQKTFGKDIKTNARTICMYDQDTLYYEDNQQIHAVSMKDGSDHVIMDFHDDHSYIIQTIIDGTLLIDAWSKGSQDLYTSTYALNPATKELKEITLKTKEPVSSVTIYDEIKDSFFVYYDHDQHLDKTWAGTLQYELDRTYYGMIKKEDFWNSKANYETFANAD